MISTKDTPERRLSVDLEQLKPLALYQSLVEQSACPAVFVLDPKKGYRFVLVNEAVCRHFGRSREELLSWSMCDFDPYFDPARLSRNVEHKERKPHVYELEQRLSSGECVPIEVALNVFVHEGEELIACYFRDIRLRRQVERSQSKHKQELKELSDNSPDIIVRYDRSGRRLYVNPSYQRLSAVSEAVLLGKTPQDLSALPAQQAAVLQTLLKQIVDSGSAHDLNLDWHTQDGEYKFFHLRAVPEFDRYGQVKSVLAIFRDITQLKVAMRCLDSFTANAPGFMYSYRQRADGRGAMPFASAGIEQIFGLQPQDVVDDVASLNARIVAADQVKLAEAMAGASRTLSSFRIELRVVHPEKGQRWAEAHATPEPDPNGGVVWHGFIIDITERKHTEELLFKREQAFQALAEHTPDTICRYDANAQRLYANQAFAKLVGRPAETLLGMPPSTLPGASGALLYEAKIRAVAQSGVEDEYEYPWTTPDGRRVVSHLRLTPEYDREGRVVSVLSVGRDITALKKTEERLKAAQRLARLDSWEWDLRQGRFEMLGAHLQFTQMKEWTRVLRKMVHPEDAQEVIYCLCGAFAEQRANLVLEFRGLAPDGSVVDTLTHVCIQYGPDGAPEFMWGTVQDVRVLKRVQRDLHALAFYDPLTKLPNRALFLERLQQEVAGTELQSRRLAVMVLDLDNFKLVNDTLGYALSDDLLCEVAERLKRCIAEQHTLARLGGDEFALILADMPSDAAIIEVARRLLDALHEIFSINGLEVFLTASIGIARFPKDGRQPSELLQHAGAAVFLAKEQGRNNYQFHSPAQTMRSAEWLVLAAALHHAVQNGEFELYYQPQIDLQTGQIVGAEALLRWNHPEMGQVPPSKFIGVAEDTGLIVSIGEWVLRTACQAAEAWNRNGEHPLKVAVNLSPRQLRSGDFVDTVWRVLRDTGCLPTWVEFEFTEGVLLDDSIDVQDLLKTLRGVGLTFAIDDFGTGYSALAYLNRFPVDKLKIDRSFISNLNSDQSSAELVKAIIAMSHSLGLQLVAEGVEEPAQESFLQAYGCQGAQGYLYGKPMPRAQFEAFLHECKQPRY